MKIMFMAVVVLALAECKDKPEDYAIKEHLPVRKEAVASAAADPKNAFPITAKGRNTCRLLREGALIMTCNETLEQCKAKEHQQSMVDTCMRKELGDKTLETLQKAYRRERGESWQKESGGMFGF